MSLVFEGGPAAAAVPRDPPPHLRDSGTIECRKRASAAEKWLSKGSECRPGCGQHAAPTSQLLLPVAGIFFILFGGELDDDEQRRREEFENQAEVGEGRGKWSGEGDHAAKGEA